MTDILQLLTDRIHTPIGGLVIVADEDGNLRATDWEDHEVRMTRLLRLHYGENGFQFERTRGLNGLTDTGSLRNESIVPLRFAPLGLPMARIRLSSSSPVTG